MWVCTACGADICSKEGIKEHAEKSPRCWEGCEEVDIGFGWVKPATSPIAAKNLDRITV